MIALSGSRGVSTRARRLVADVLLSAAAFFTVAVLPVLQIAYSDFFALLRGLLGHVAIYAAVAVVALSLTRTYRMIWRYVSFSDFLALLGAVSLTLIGFLAVELLLLNPMAEVPAALLAWTVFLLWTANVGFLATPRFVARIIAERLNHNGHSGTERKGNPVQVLLAGETTRIESFIRDCEHDPQSRYRAVGILADEAHLHGSYFHGVPVIDSVANLPSVLNVLADHGMRPHTLVCAQDNPSRADLAKLLELTAAANLKLGRLPPSGLASDGMPVLPINLSDLLHRPEIHINMGAVATLVGGKCVMVTGGGGSIGSELCRQLAAHKPSKLIVLDYCEFNLYSIDKELEEKFPGLRRETALVDVRDTSLVMNWIGKEHPYAVFHAAALKHVPLVEAHPIEGIKTNVFGTINVAQACCEHRVPLMVTISTDKAVNPTNVMGATKRLAEAYCQGLDQALMEEASTRFVTVRFGNVLGSAGSVVPLFQHQIENGGPVTVTDPEIKRFFMTIPEAVTLVLQAGAHGLTTAEERGNIYLLDMGEPVKIIDLARQMIRLAGARPEIDIKIKIVGLRPGEKLYEETVHIEETILPTRNKSILKLAPRTTDLRIVRQQVQELRQACQGGDRERALRLLRISVPDYLPQAVLASVS